MYPIALDHDLIKLIQTLTKRLFIWKPGWLGQRDSSVSEMNPPCVEMKAFHPTC